MILRTPRRRISPRTKRRYRAIREFFRRAIGSSSQPDIEINSSVAVNVTDLKHKIVGLEHQLNQVSKHCRELVSLENFSKKSDSIIQAENHDDRITKEGAVLRSSGNKVNNSETKILYKTSNKHYKKSESDSSPKTCDTNESTSHTMNLDLNGSNVKKKKSKLNNSYELNRHKTRSAYENFPTPYSTSSFHSLLDARMERVDPCYSRHQDKKKVKREYLEIMPNQLKKNKMKEHVKRKQENFLMNSEEKHCRRTRKIRHCQRELDQDFIADIVRRQYKPIKLFGKRESDISQFTAPVCRDQEFSIQDHILEGPDLCSCCYDNHRPIKLRHNELCDMRSICDTRLYSSKKPKRHRHGRGCTDVYNDSELYDLVPVKEKSSPKSRKKFEDDNMATYYYREVPPSPRTLRPKLNLKAQYSNEFEDCLTNNKRANRKGSPTRLRRSHNVVDTLESDISSDIPENRKMQQQKILPKQKIPVQTNEQMTQDTGTMSSLQYTCFNDPNVTANTSLNKTRETDSSRDKTDKALCEIKDILQSFLHEIKKESTSQFDKSDVVISNKINDKDIGETKQNSTNSNILPNSNHNLNNYSVAQCNMPPPYMPAFPSPCCYPVLPVCPMNCLQNGYVGPSPSFTCTHCANNATKDTVYSQQPSKSARNEINNNETEELIKEIYKYVTHSSETRENEREDRNEIERDDRRIGDRSKASKQDANVGTSRMKFYSKSCEAINSRIISEAYYSGTNVSYSDTILEKLSLEATGSGTTSEPDFDLQDVNKGKKNKFTRVLQSFGIFKRKKKDIIEELSESESAIEVEIKPKSTPFRQEILNYSMHGQELYQRPPIGMPYEQSHSYQDYRPPLKPAEYPHINDIYNPKSRQNPDRGPHHYNHHAGPSHHNLEASPSVPPYPSPYNNYNHVNSQVPLCLKEIEVKSIGTQSERKMSFFRKIKRRMQPGEQVAQKIDHQKTCSTQTAGAKPNLFNWKNFQNLETKLKVEDPMNFSLKTQKELAEGNQYLKKALMKKLFYKRNPFSPRNLIMKTLLGKDKASFGNPPRMHKARMFF